MESSFTLESEALALPPGAVAGSERIYLRHGGRPVLGLTQGRRRPCIYPLFTPAGYAATSESPADHPHHNSVWIAADHVNAHVPTTPGHHEIYSYNFYVDETFQGRAAGTLRSGQPTLTHLSESAAMIQCQIEWRGPVEWGAPNGRTIAQEMRSIMIEESARAWILDVTSELTPTDWDLSLGPTRHAYFNARVADRMVVALGGRVRDDRGRIGGESIGNLGSRWIAFEGPVGGDRIAGVAVIPDPADIKDVSWFVADWGVVSVGTFRLAERKIKRGQRLRTRCRFVVYDGTVDDAVIEAWHAAFPRP